MLSKATKVTAMYRANESEIYSVEVKVASGYPDALDEARAQAVRGVREMLASAIALSAEDE